MKSVIKVVFVAVGLVLVFTPAVLAEAPYQVSWAKQFGTAGTDESFSVAVDGSGNTYIAGFTDGDIAAANAGLNDAFLIKLDSLGIQLWSKQIGTAATDESRSVAVDGSGNVYITGVTWGDLAAANAGESDAFLVKYDSSGNHLWSQQIGTVGEDESNSVAVDGSGNAYISGWTNGDIAAANAGLRDAFLVKFDSSGNQLWSKQLGSADYDYGRSVAVDGSDNVYIAGFSFGSIGGTNPNPGVMDGFVVKYDSSGNRLWSKQIGTTNKDWAYSVAVDGSDNVYIAGRTQGDMDGTNAGGPDTFLVKYDSSGNLLWTKQIGSSENDQNRSVAVDASGNAYTTGFTTGDLGGTNAGDWDAFLVKYDSSGNHLWSQQIGTASSDMSWSVAVDGSGNAYISGSTEGDLDGTNAGGSDAFLVKFAGTAVVGRYVFYNQSAWDWNNPDPGGNDDGAIATDKAALLPGETASFANYTSYWRGISGIMIDATNTGGTASASDFTFKVGNDSTPSGWATAPAPTSVTIRPGAGAVASDRITVMWGWWAGGITGKWLQVTYIPAGDVFYFGNAIGDTGNSASDAEVTPTDEVYVRNNQATLAVNPAAIDHAGDFNRDKKVGPTDQVISRNNGTNSSTALQLITVP